MIPLISNVCDSITTYCDSIERCLDPVFEPLVNLIEKIASAVAHFFNVVCEKIDEFFGFEPTQDDPPPQPYDPYYDPIYQEPAGWDEARFPYNLPAQVNPADREQLREILRTNGRNPDSISDQMKVADFTALCEEYPISVRIQKGDGTVLRQVQVQKIDEAQNMLYEIKVQIRRDEGEEAARAVQSRFDFPHERTRIGEWARRWAERKNIKIDREHPYFEIFQAALQHKNEIRGGEYRSDQPEDYSVFNEGYLNGSLFEYIINSLLGFQELSREENRELMRLLDNHKPTFHENLAYQYARALSKIYCYPTAAAYNVMDVYDKLQIGIGAPMEAFRAAQEHDKVLEYFQNAFQNRNCFDFRVSEFTQFIFRLNNPHADDFVPNIVQGDPIDRKAPEYFRVFKNEQVMKMARDQGLNYGELKRSVDRGENNPNTQNFYQNYCTKDHFAEYLAENHHPLKDLVVVDGGVPLIPEQPEWEGKIPHGFKVVPNHLIPQGHREVGRVVGVRDPRLYLATVQRDRRPGFDYSYKLVFSKARPAGWQRHLPIIPFEVHWNGLNDAEITPDILPADRRNTGSQVLIRDPAIYQVKVHALEVGSVTLDFRGEPISRERWEAILTEDYWEV